MCGLAGFIGITKAIPKNKDIRNCKFSLKRRGPDNSGIYKKKVNDNSLLFIHTRLSIVDLNIKSSQPFSDKKGTTLFWNVGA